MSSTAEEIGQDFIRQSKFRMLDESLPRILQCLEESTEEEIWFRPNENTVSMGNLVLHLCGNVRQWIITGLGGAPDHRVRQAEFDEKGPLRSADLVERLTTTMEEAARVMDEADPAALAEARIAQGEDTTGIGIILHVVEHFAYHTGQIALAVKSRKNVDLGYYADRDLDVTS